MSQLVISTHPAAATAAVAAPVSAAGAAPAAEHSTDSYAGVLAQLPRQQEPAWPEPQLPEQLQGADLPHAPDMPMPQIPPMLLALITYDSAVPEVPVPAEHAADQAELMPPTWLAAAPVLAEYAADQAGLISAPAAPPAEAAAAWPTAVLPGNPVTVLHTDPVLAAGQPLTLPAAELRLAVSADTAVAGYPHTDIAALPLPATAPPAEAAAAWPAATVLPGNPVTVLHTDPVLAAGQPLPLPAATELRLAVSADTAVAGNIHTDVATATATALLSTAPEAETATVTVQHYTATGSSQRLTGLSRSAPGFDSLPQPLAMPLQPFIRQGGITPVLYQEAVSGVSQAVAGLQPASAVAGDTVFQWKAEQLGSQSSQWGQKLVHLLSDKINLQLGQHIQRAQIRLDPPRLGLIELIVTMDADRTSVQLYASNSQMRDAMQQNLEQLRQQLAQRLGSDQQLDIDVRDQHAQQQQPHSQAGGTIAAQLADDEQTAATGTVAALSTDRLNRLV